MAVGILRFFSETTDWTVSVGDRRAAGDTLLAIALDHGVPIPFTCDAGACGACLVEVETIGVPVAIAPLTEQEAFLLAAMGKSGAPAAGPQRWRLACQYVVGGESIAVYFQADLAGW